MSYLVIEGGRILSVESGHLPNIFTGLDSAKPLSPGIGDTYISTDNQKMYQCFISGSWTVIQSATEHHFSQGAGGTSDDIVTAITGTGTATAGSNRMTLNNGTTQNSSAVYRTALQYSPSDGYNLGAVIVLDSALTLGSVLTPGFPNVFKCGLFFVADGTDNNIEAVFSVDNESGQWKAVTQTGVASTSTNITTPSPLGSGEYIFSVYASQIGNNRIHVFLVNGSVVATHRDLSAYANELFGGAYVYALGTPNVSMEAKVNYISMRAIL